MAKDYSTLPVVALDLIVDFVFASEERENKFRVCDTPLMPYGVPQTIAALRASCYAFYVVALRKTLPVDVFCNAGSGPLFAVRNFFYTLAYTFQTSPRMAKSSSLRFVMRLHIDKLSRLARLSPKMLWAPEGK